MNNFFLGPIQDMPDIVATLKGVEIIAAPHLKPNIRRSIHSGEYEKPEIEFGLANLQPGDRILEMGTGAGIVGSVFLKNIEHLTLRSFEANPDLIPHIQKLYIHNKLAHAASVSNNLIVSGDNAPSHMDFTIKDNFLGSRIADGNDNSGARTERIFTRHYDEIKTTYPHNVLVMDIEGGELDFLEHADLSKLDLIMLELHPKVYGHQGRAKVIKYISRQGFLLDKETSSGQVASFKKPARMKIPPDYSWIGNGRPPQYTYDLDPQEPVVEKIITVDKAVLAQTPGSEGFQIVASVFDEKRHNVPEAVCWVSHRKKATAERTHPRANRIKDLPGTWLFGGRFFPHFGHFLMETLARVWALDHINEPVEGVLFFTSESDCQDAAAKMFTQLADIMDISLKYKICDKFYRVDKLIVPPQASGIGRLSLSSPDLREFILKRLKRDLPPTGHDKIYISRTGQFNKVGRVFLGEKRLEQLLMEQGYTIFHPQDHSWQEQLRHYLSATHILGPDGSPFHLVNFTGRADVKVGIIQRRPDHTANQLSKQGQLYGLENIHALRHLGRYWGSAGDHRAGLRLVCEVRFESLCKELKKKGFISNTANWSNFTEAEIRHDLEKIAVLAGADQRPVENVGESLKHYPACLDPEKPQVFCEPAPQALLREALEV